MSKAILELPKMPESCSKCPLQAISTEKKIRYCTVMGYVTEYYGTKRRENCPLKWAEIELGKRHIKILQKRNNTWQKRYSTLDAGYNKLFKDFCKLQQKIAQLQAQVTQMREALTVAKDAIKAAWSDGSANAALDKASEALAEIDKAIGGKEDV